MIEINIPTKEEIDFITFDPEIWERISDDTLPPKEQFKLSYEIFEFRGFYIEKKLIALASIEKDGNFHFEVLKPYRKFSREILRICLSHLEKSVYCIIPSLHRSVINFAKKNGFKEIGESGKFFIKNKIIYPQIKLIYVKCS